MLRTYQRWSTVAIERLHCPSEVVITEPNFSLLARMLWALIVGSGFLDLDLGERSRSVPNAFARKTSFADFTMTFLYSTVSSIVALPETAASTPYYVLWTVNSRSGAERPFLSIWSTRQ